MKQKIFFALLIVLVIVTIVTTVMIISNPLRQSEKEIKNDLLSTIPIGTSLEDAITIIEKDNKWDILWVDNNGGYGIDRDGYPHEMNSDDIQDREVFTEVGEQYMRINSEYGVLFVNYAYVDVYFAFDGDSKLMELTVYKGTNI